MDFVVPPGHPLCWISALLLGCCIGSFLNVVIYRMPLGLSVNRPRRSFCPHCQAAIPAWRNIPVLSWLLLRGKCADCRQPISPRYPVVELLCGLLFVGVWWVVLRWNGGASWGLEHAVAIPLWVLVAALIGISFIDAEHMIIPLEFTVTGAVAGVAGALLMPRLPDLAQWWPGPLAWTDGLKMSLLGAAIGYGGLWLVVLLGKLAFGKVEWKFDQPVAWRLEEPEKEDEPIRFHMAEEVVDWWDLFFRKSDKLEIEADSVRANGEERGGGKIVIRQDGVTLADGSRIALEDLRTLEGTGRRAVVPREAMGMGDVHLLGMLGAFCGPLGVFFMILCSSVLAILAALLGRIGFGMRLPFGPFLALSSLVWLFGGWQLAQWYLSLILRGT